MPEILKHPHTRLLDLHSRPEARIIVGLAGYPGSGKSTVARAWAAELNRQLGPGSLTVLEMDGFHLSKAQLSKMEKPEEAFARRGAPYTFNPRGLVAKMKELHSAVGKKDVGWPGFEHEVGDPAEDALQVAANAHLILVEGIYTLLRQDDWAPLDELFDESWFLDIPLETAMERVAKRHQRAWNMSPEEARSRADSNDRLNCAFIAPGRETADFLIVP